MEKIYKDLSELMGKDTRINQQLLLLQDNSDLLRFITKYDCKPSDIAEIVRLKSYDPSSRYPIVDIKLKPRKKSNIDKIKEFFKWKSN